MTGSDRDDQDAIPSTVVMGSKLASEESGTYSFHFHCQKFLDGESQCVEMITAGATRWITGAEAEKTAGRAAQKASGRPGAFGNSLIEVQGWWLPTSAAASIIKTPAAGYPRPNLHEIIDPRHRIGRSPCSPHGGGNGSPWGDSWFWPI